MAFFHVKAGDTVTRMFAGKIPMNLKVSYVTDKLIVCGKDEHSGWCFDRKVGFEVDKQIGWGLQKNGSIHTGSYLVPYQPKD